jgi:hypothetical protein
MLSNGYNLFRWVEYSLSASIMLTNILGLINKNDYVTHLSVFGGSFITNIIGIGIELGGIGQKSNIVRWISLLVSWLAFALTWIPIIDQYIGFVDYFNFLINKLKELGYIGQDSVRIPPFVKYIVWVLLGLYLTFPVNNLFQLLKLYDNLYAEFIYIILSFTAKAVLTIMIFSGTLRDDEPQFYDFPDE